MAQTRQRTVGSHIRLRAHVPRIGPGRWGLALIEVVLGYLWLLSALNKLLNPKFRSALARVLQGQFSDQYREAGPGEVRNASVRDN